MTNTSGRGIESSIPRPLLTWPSIHCCLPWVDREDWLMFASLEWQLACTMFNIMATSSPLPEAAQNLPTANSPAPALIKRSVASLLLTTVAGAVISSAALGGALLYLVRSGRLSLHKGAASKSVSSAEPRTHLLAIDPLLVNLSDSDGSTYARLSITLEVENSTTAEDSKKSDNKSGGGEVAAVRDTVLTVLGQQTANDLLAVNGKEDLKAKLLKAFNQNNPGLKVRKILFTDFLVQR